ncbi:MULTISPECIES: hypothetical protein [unclassified Dehalobacter]|uniref:hypothetical protein n=1 Tax=unclassified Dehalobacter TaxID=2635733 RepID=UPI000E6BCD43|nr:MULTISPECIES: hypothetical protein [unclassified Dehalobacter]RJE46796.1 hypothetical protein A7K50_06370 [Dehalobacter sp. MCB1]TCX49244.1 hypothetical protein C1I36_10125 [Dehalobacter sp. 14DCB1]TCX49824.1 hypothetical protein C1I38_13155 [Dehalobacter sp. 12DCB1]
MSRISNILENKGPLLSGSLANELVNQFSISREAARKEISRASAPIRKLKNVTFDNNQKYLYLDSHFSSDIFFEKLLQYLRLNSKAYYYFIKAVLNNYGYILTNEIATYTCSPVQPLKGHKPADSIIKDLLYINLLLDNGDGLFQLNPSVDIPQSYTRFKALNIAKKNIMNDFYDWSRKINLVAYNSGRMIEQMPEFHKFQWSFTAPSYINGLQKGSKPGFVVADVVLGKKLLEEDIEYFLAKVNVISQSKKHSPFIPVLIVEGIEENAFSRLKSAGVVLGFIDKLFGNQYLETLRALVSIVENASAVITKNPDKYFEFIEALSKLEGKASNLKGDVFELAVGYYYSQLAPYLEINKLITERESGKSKEIDVYVKYPTEARFVECKGYSYPLDEEYVSKWLSDNIPTIRKWALSQDEFTHKDLIFELWSTGGFEQSAIDKLQKAAGSTKKYTIRFFDAQQIAEKAKEAKNDNLNRILKNYFTSNSL